MHLFLKEAVAIVTGSTRGIGRGIAEAFLQEGAHVLLTGRTQETVGQTVAVLAAQYGDDHVRGFAGDLTQSTTIAQCIAAAVDRWGRSDIAVASLGSGQSRPFSEADPAEWERVFRLNLFGGMELARHVEPVMRRQGGGSMVFISSIAGIEAMGAPLPYAAAKAALLACVKGLAHQLAPAHIRVNAVAPGNVRFPGSRWEERIKADPALEQRTLDQVPLRRFGSPEDIAATVVFLASERSSFTTGACFVVDGGQARSI